MRFPFITTLIAGAVLTHVGANPVRLLIVTSTQEGDIESTYNTDVFRFGHSVPSIPHRPVPTLAPAGSGGKVHRPCRGRLHDKTLKISNAFRKLFGLPLIHPTGAVTASSTNAAAPADGEYRILPFIGTPTSFVEVGPDEHHHHHHHHHKHHHKHGGFKHKSGERSFMKRLHFAITALGPWEGRAVAFVLGCGIGVLLRMLWVIAIVSYRLVKSPKEEGHKYSEVIVVEHYQDDGEAVVAPPTYTYADEKPDNKVATADAPEETK